MVDEVMDPWDKIMSEGAGGKTVSFLTKNVVIKGTLMEDPVERDQIDLKTKEVKTFKDGNVRKVWVFRLQTDERDPADPEDKGVRNLWAKPDAIKKIRENLKAQGLSRMPIGATLEIAWTGEIPTDGYPIKTFTVRVTPPPAGFMAGGEVKGGESFSFDTAPVATNSAQPTSPLDALKAMQASGPQAGTDSDIPF
jgi:hypothetical protein